MGAKFRRVTRSFIERDPDGKPKSVTGFFLVESLHNGKWLPVGDEKGICKFKSAQLRDEFLLLLKGEHPVEKVITVQ